MYGWAACLAFLVPATAAALYPLALTLAGRASRRATTRGEPTLTFAILVPAHDEETTLPATLRALAALDYPRDKYRVLVVADNCADGTAAVARGGGAGCVVRADGERRGKGFAIAAGLEALATAAFDVVLILDADCTLNPTALRELDAAFATGAAVVQAAVRSRNADDGPAGYVAAVGAAVDEALAAGRDRFGGSVALRGTGMAFRHWVLPLLTWDTASPVEDAEYGRQLRAAGVRVQFCGGAVVACDAPAAVAALCRQRRRWAAAGPFASKPLLLAHLVATVVVCAAVGAFGWWAAALVLGTAAVYLHAMAKVGLTKRRVRLFLHAPFVVARLVGVTLGGWLRHAPAWDRTPRFGEGRAA